MKNAKYGPYVNQYIDYYGINIDDPKNVIPSLTFQNVDKELADYVKLTKKTIDKELLNKIKNDQLKLIKLQKIIR